MRSVFLFGLLCLFCLQPVLGQDTNLVLRGIPAGIDTLSEPDLHKYQSRIDFPAFVSWEGPGILLNGGRVLYKMNRPKGAITERYKASRVFEDGLSPDKQYFLCLDDEDGDEQYQLFLFDIKSDTTVAITTPGTRSTNPFWSPDSKQILYKNNRRDPMQTDLYIRNVRPPYKDRLLLQDITDEAIVCDWDIQRNRILLVKVISENNKELFIYDINTGTLQQVNAGKRDIAYANALFIPGTNDILVVCDEPSEFLTLVLYHLKDGTSKWLTPDIHQDIDEISLNKKKDLLAFTVNASGKSLLYRMDLKSLVYKQARLPEQGMIRGMQLNAEGNEVAFNFYASTFRRKVCSYNFETARWSHWHQKARGRETDFPFVPAEDIRVRAYNSPESERYDIAGFMYRPRVRGPHPVYIDIHGGPEYQALPVFNRWHQYLVNELHIAVIVPNIRGSNGYGKSFMKADDGQLREHATRDVGVLLDWIAASPDLDPHRVALFGESYGGYMVLSALARYPGRIRCGIDVVGSSNLVTFLENTAGYRKDLRRAEFGDERDPVMRDFLSRIAPVHNTGNINAPVLIVQGYNDPRVPAKESERMFAALESRSVSAWYLGAKDEGHGFRKAKNITLQRKLELFFLKTFLLP